MPEVLIAIRLIHFAAAMAAFGAAAFRFYVTASGAGAFGDWLARLIRITAWVALGAAVALVPATAANITGSWTDVFDPATLGTVLLKTQFGHAWCWHLAFSAALALVSLRRPGCLLLALAALSLASLAWTGHAAAMPGIAGLGHRLNQAVHLLAGGAWLGGLLPLYGLLRRMPAGGGDLVRDGVAHFSPMGYIAVALIAVTGVVNSCLLVGSVGALFDTAYGRLLAVKIALYLVMVALALVNRVRLAPRLGLGRNQGALVRNVAVEQALGLAILAVVSVLGTWPPAAMGHAM